MDVPARAKNCGPAGRLGISMFTIFAPMRQPCAWAAPAQAGQKAVLKGQPGEPAAG